jgi:hypothetical protein
MNCRACQAWLQRCLDGEAGGYSAAVERHLRYCPECIALEAAARRLDEGLRLLAPPAPPPGLAGAVAGAVLRDFRARRARRARRWAAAATALAAALLLSLGLRAVTSTRPNTDSPAPPVARSGPEAPPSAAPPRDEARAVPLRDAVNKAGSAVASLTSRTADEAAGHTRLLLPAVAPPPLPDLALAGPLEPAVGPLREAGQGVSAGLEPVATSARRAVDLFLRDLPPIDGEARPGL